MKTKSRCDGKKGRRIDGRAETPVRAPSFRPRAPANQSTARRKRKKIAKTILLGDEKVYNLLRHLLFLFVIFSTLLTFFANARHSVIFYHLFLLLFFFPFFLFPYCSSFTPAYLAICACTLYSLQRCGGF